MNKQNILFLYSSIAVCILLIFSACATNEQIIETTENTPQAKTALSVSEADETKDEFKVSEELYTKTFTDIEQFIYDLNKIIRNQNFTGWKKYLTQEYIDHYSDLNKLKALSDTPTLKKYNIVIRSLKDYFLYVVAPSRSDVKLDEISFIDDDNIKAYMIIDGDPVVLYNLKYINKTWKIGL